MNTTPPGRAAALAGLIASLPTASGDPTATDAPPAPAAPPSAAPDPAAKPARARSSKTAPDASTGRRSVIVHLTGAQAATLRALAADTGLPAGEVVLDLLAEHWDALDGVWAAAERAHGLPARQPARARTDPLRAGVHLRFAADALDALDTRAAAVGAPSRTALIARLLDLAGAG